MMRDIPTAPAFISPLSLTFEVDGHALQIGPMNVEQLAQVMGMAGPVLDALMAMPDAALARLQSGSPTAGDLAVMLELLSDQASTALRLVQIASQQNEGWVKELLPDRFAYLFSVCVLVNADFFSRARPVFAAAGALLLQAKQVQDTGVAAASTGPGSSTP